MLVDASFLNKHIFISAFHDLWAPVIALSVIIDLKSVWCQLGYSSCSNKEFYTLICIRLESEVCFRVLTFANCTSCCLRVCVFSNESLWTLQLP